MHHFWKKLTASALAGGMLLSLAACGGGDEEEKPGASQGGTVFVPKYIAVDGENMSWRSVLTDKGIYTSRMPEGDGETPSAQQLVCIDPLTGETAVVAEIPAEDDTYLQDIVPAADGSLWYSLQTSEPIYEEGFDPETFTGEDIWEHITEYRSTCVWHRLGADGAEAQTLDVTSLQEKLGLDYFPDTRLDGQGNIYAYTSTENGQKIAVFDPELNPLFELDANEYGGLYRLGDGAIAIQNYGEQGAILTEIDPAAKGLGAKYDLKTYANDILPGCSGYQFFYADQNHLNGWKKGADAPEPLLDWGLVDVSPDSVRGVSIPEKGVFHLLTRDYETDSMELAVLTETPADQAPKTETLTLGMMYADQQTRRKVIDFNRHNDKAVRIELRDYSQYNTETDYMAGLQQLNTEILAGNGPDLFSTQGIPVERFAAKGLLEDLWTYIDKDPELGRDKLMTRPLEAACVDGKLTQVFDSFSIFTQVASQKIVGDITGWTLDDVREALARMPEGAVFSGAYSTKTAMLQNLLSRFSGSYMNWSTGECSFDSPEFIDLLKFCDEVSEYTDYDDIPENLEPPSTTAELQEGRQLATDFFMSNLQEMQLYRAVFNGELAFPGMPTPDGSCGSAFLNNNGLSMSSKCRNKEAAWAFLRTLLMDSGTERDGGWGFPINKAQFDARMKKLMTPEYELDMNGKPVLDENGQKIEVSQGGWGWDNVQIEIYAVPQEDYDTLMRLYNEIGGSMIQDTESFKIIMDEAMPFFAGKTTAEAAAQQIQSRMHIYVNEQR